MISEKLKQKILPELKDHLVEDDYKYIEEMFSEVYYTNFDGIERVTLKPHPEAGDIAMQFNIVNGNFIEITSYEYIQSVGEKV